MDVGTVMKDRPRRPVGSFQPIATRSMIAPPETPLGEWDWTAARAICLREACRVLGASPEAEDAAQEAALRAWRNRASCRAGDSRKPWLATIARREALRLAAARRTTPIEDGPEPACASHEGDALDRVAVRQAIARLAPRDRSLLFGRYWADMTQDQLARALDLPEGTAKVRLHRARAELRRLLSHHGS
jgi:RNA polymerase sigma-70 factor (ECF subfamily)